VVPQAVSIVDAFMDGSGEGIEVGRVENRGDLDQTNVPARVAGLVCISVGAVAPVPRLDVGDVKIVVNATEQGVVAGVDVLERVALRAECLERGRLHSLESEQTT